MTNLLSLKFSRESRIESSHKTSIYMENICNSGVVTGVGVQEFSYWISDTFSRCLYNFILQHPCSEVRAQGARKGILYTFWRTAALWIRHIFGYKFSFPNISKEQNLIIHITESRKHFVWERPMEVSSQNACFKHGSGYWGHYATESQKLPTVEIPLFLGNLL